MLVEVCTAFQALKMQANAQMASLAAQLAEFKRQVFGPRGESIAVLQPELWHEMVEIPVPPEVRRPRQGTPAPPARPPGDRPRSAAPAHRARPERGRQGGLRTRHPHRRGGLRDAGIHAGAARSAAACTAEVPLRGRTGASTIRTAWAQPSPIARSNAGAGLLAQVMVSKYADHCPLARQERILARHGARLSRQTLCDWTLGAAELLAPLMAPLKRHILGSAVIFTDDTTLKLKAERGSIGRQDHHRAAVGVPRRWLAAR